MILGIGTDLVDIRRIDELLDRHGMRFIDKHFTKTEQEYAEEKTDIKQCASTYAKRFAAKEAFVKALGSGVRDGVFLRDIGVVHNEYGAPSFVLSGEAQNLLKKRTPEYMEPHVHLSLSDEPPYALAYVIIEARPKT